MRDLSAVRGRWDANAVRQLQVQDVIYHSTFCSLDGLKLVLVILDGLNMFVLDELTLFLFWPLDGLNLNELITATRRRPGSFPGASELPPVMSPRSVETTSLGINMAEYVLGTSPLGRELDNRLPGMHRFVSGGHFIELKIT